MGIDTVGTDRALPCPAMLLPLHIFLFGASCDDSSATQIGQIENFVSSKCDLIMVHPSDAAAIEGR